MKNLKHALWLAIFLFCISFGVAACQDHAGANPNKDYEQLAAIDDSVEAKAACAKKMIETGMRAATDSLSYYEYCVRMGKYYCLSATPDSMKPYVESTIRFAKAQPDGPRRNSMLALCYNLQAMNYHNFHKSPDEVVTLYHDAYTLLTHSDSKDQMPKVCANLGDAYLFKNQLPQAANWYRRALFLVDSLCLPKKENVTLYLGLATIYLQLNDFDTSLAYYKQTQKYFDQMSVGMQAYFLNNYGNFYYYKQDYTASLAKFEELKRLLEKHQMEQNFDMYLCKLNMADVYLNLGKIALSEKYLGEVEPYMAVHGDEIAIYYCHTIRIGQAVKKNDMQAVGKILASEKKTDGIPFSIRKIRNLYLRKYYEAMGDYRMAYENLCEDDQQNDSLEHNRINMRASEIMERFAQDTLQLHHSLAIEHKNADIQKANAITFAAIGLALVLALLLALWVMRSHKRYAQDKMSIMQLKLNSARNRISPHFVFNVLNNKIINSNQQEANELLELTKLIRTNLDMSCRLDTHLREELDFVRQYVAVESKLVGDDFTFVVDIAPEVDVEKVRIPSMFVQILVENAFVHGLKGWDGHKELRISVSRQAKNTRIGVTDNGKGFDIRCVRNSRRTGLNIITQTIAIVNERNKNKIKFSLHNITNVDRTVAGCEASILMPDAIRLLS